MDRLEKRVQVLVQALTRSSKDFFVSRIDIQNVFEILIRYPDYVLKVLGHLTKSLFAFAKRLLSADSIQGLATVIGQRREVFQCSFVISPRTIALNRKKAGYPGRVANRHGHDRCRRARLVAERNIATFEPERICPQCKLRAVLDNPTTSGGRRARLDARRKIDQLAIDRIYIQHGLNPVRFGII